MLGRMTENFVFMEDAQATRDAALGRAVRKWLHTDTANDLRRYIRECVRTNNSTCSTSCMLQTLYSVIAAALEAEEAHEHE